MEKGELFTLEKQGSNNYVIKRSRWTGAPWSVWVLDSGPDPVDGILT